MIHSLTGRDGGGMAAPGHKTMMPARLSSENAKPFWALVTRSDEAGQNLLG
jgi:hypothetical protein